MTVAAPRTQWSGIGTALATTEIGESDPRRVGIERFIGEQLPLPAAPNVRSFTVAASPALIMVMAARGAFGAPPDLLTSGINRGPNVGVGILHSGTLGAAFTAATYGIPALALSMSSATCVHWETAANVATTALSWITHSHHPNAVLNVNIPDCALDGMKGIKQAALGPHSGMDAGIGSVGCEYGILHIPSNGIHADPSTDISLLCDDWATATLLQSSREIGGIELLETGEPGNW